MGHGHGYTLRSTAMLANPGLVEAVADGARSKTREASRFRALQLQQAERRLGMEETRLFAQIRQNQVDNEYRQSAQRDQVIQDQIKRQQDAAKQAAIAARDEANRRIREEQLKVSQGQLQQRIEEGKTKKEIAQAVAQKKREANITKINQSRNVHLAAGDEFLSPEVAQARLREANNGKDVGDFTILADDDGRETRVWFGLTDIGRKKATAARKRDPGDLNDVDKNKIRENNTFRREIVAENAALNRELVTLGKQLSDPIALNSKENAKEEFEARIIAINKKKAVNTQRLNQWARENNAIRKKVSRSIVPRINDRGQLFLSFKGRNIQLPEGFNVKNYKPIQVELLSTLLGLEPLFDENDENARLVTRKGDLSADKLSIEAKQHIMRMHTDLNGGTDFSLMSTSDLAWYLRWVRDPGNKSLQKTWNWLKETFDRPAISTATPEVKKVAAAKESFFGQRELLTSSAAGLLTSLLEEPAVGTGRVTGERQRSVLPGAADPARIAPDTQQISPPTRAPSAPVPSPAPTEEPEVEASPLEAANAERQQISGSIRELIGQLPRIQDSALSEGLREEIRTLGRKLRSRGEQRASQEDLTALESLTNRVNEAAAAAPGVTVGEEPEPAAAPVTAEQLSRGVTPPAQLTKAQRATDRKRTALASTIIKDANVAAGSADVSIEEFDAAKAEIPAILDRFGIDLSHKQFKTKTGRQIFARRVLDLLAAGIDTFEREEALSFFRDLAR